MPDRLTAYIDAHHPPSCFLVEFAYVDLFGNALTASAIFDGSGVGAWRELRVTSPEDPRDRPTLAS